MKGTVFYGIFIRQILSLLAKMYIELVYLPHSEKEDAYALLVQNNNANSLENIEITIIILSANSM